MPRPYAPAFWPFIAAVTLVLCLALPCLGAERRPSAPPPAPPSAPLAAVYTGNVKTGKYHNASCRYFSCKNCTARFASPREAKQQGFTACNRCGG